MLKNLKSDFNKNLIYAFTAQIISLASSVAISFMVPKILGVTEFAYWQLFLFYVSYINISRLGIIDGLYLKLGGRDIDTIDKDLLKTEWLVFIILQILFAFVMFKICSFIVMDKNRLWVLLICSICLILINNNNYFGFILQALNKTSIYSISEIIYNIFWFIGIALIYTITEKSYKVIVILYTIGQFCAGIYLMYKCKWLFKAKCINIKYIIRDIFDNIKLGMPILMAMYASMFIIGSARFIVDFKLGIKAFGAFSFALSLSTFVLKFISQISMVLFPMLRHLNNENLKKIYKITKDFFSYVLPIMLVSYLPITFFLNYWLPQYNNSIIYFGILLPICLFDGKMQLIYSTYFKVFKEGKALLLVNIIAAFVCFILSIISIVFTKDLKFIAISINLAIMTRCYLSEFYINKLLHVKVSYKQILMETMLMIVFVIAVMIFSSVNAIIIYILFYIIYCICSFNEIKNILAISKKCLLKN